MSLLFSRKFWTESIGLRARLTFLSGMTYFLYTGLALIFAPLPAVLMVCVFPDKVFWWNYLLLVPALLQTFVFLPRWHRTQFGFDAMRTKIVYAWAHLFAFRDRLARRPLAWSPTGGPSGTSSGRLRVVKTLIVAWPLATFAAVVAGSVAHMESILDANYWPPLAAAAVYATAAALVLQPLGTTRYVGMKSAARRMGSIRSGMAGAPAEVLAATPSRLPLDAAGDTRSPGN